MTISHDSQEFLDLVNRSYKEKPKQSDLDQLQKYLKENPGIWKDVFDLENGLQKGLILKMVSEKVWQIALEENMAEMKTSLNYCNSSKLEQLLIENIVSAWLNYQWANGQVISLMSKGSIQLVSAEFWDKQLSSAQRRYLRACETLAKVRRLTTNQPVVQVNIATANGQQVNVAGDVTKST